jgi:hypothetical protein
MLKFKTDLRTSEINLHNEKEDNYHRMAVLTQCGLKYWQPNRRREILPVKSIIKII